MEALKQEQCNEQQQFEKVLNDFKIKQISRFLGKKSNILHVVYLNKMIYLRSFNQNGNN